VVKNAHNDSETTLTKFLYDFVTVTDMVIIPYLILLLVIIETVVCCFVYFPPLNAAWLLGLLALYFLSFSMAEEIYNRVLKHFSLLIIIHQVAEFIYRFLAGHREFMLSISHHRVCIS